MKTKFDSRGNLLPYEVAEWSIKDFENSFVIAFGQDSSRLKIFADYQKFIFSLKSLVTHNCYQWIDGSFVTNKKNPRDIDVVTFIDYRDFEKIEIELKQNFGSNSLREKYNIDAYFIVNYPKNHNKHIFTQSDLLYWKSFFGKTRINRANKQFDKGLILLNL